MMLYTVHLKVSESDSGKGVLETESVLSGEELGDPTDYTSVVDRLSALIDRDPNGIVFSGA